MLIGHGHGLGFNIFFVCWVVVSKKIPRLNQPINQHAVKQPIKQLYWNILGPLFSNQSHGDGPCHGSASSDGGCHVDVDDRRWAGLQGSRSGDPRLPGGHGANTHVRRVSISILFLFLISLSFLHRRLTFLEEGCCHWGGHGSKLSSYMIACQGKKLCSHGSQRLLVIIHFC